MMMMMIFIISLGLGFRVLSPRDVITHYDVKTISKFMLYENLCKGVWIQHEIEKKQNTK